jgi:hypothetical protein
MEIVEEVEDTFDISFPLNTGIQTVKDFVMQIQRQIKTKRDFLKSDNHRHGRKQWMN